MEEVEDEVLRFYSPIVECFYHCIHSKYFTWQQLPYKGGIFEQPNWLMLVFNNMKSIYAEEMNKELKKK